MKFPCRTVLPVSASRYCTTHASADTGRTARGVAIDRETGKRISEAGADGSPEATAYPHEKEWATMHPARRPPFLSLHHEDDGIVDLSCHGKLVKQLRAHGYADEALIIKGSGKQSVEAHLWTEAYNAPVLDFFTKIALADGSSAARALAPGDHRLSLSERHQTRILGACPDRLR